MSLNFQPFLAVLTGLMKVNEETTKVAAHFCFLDQFWTTLVPAFYCSATRQTVMPLDFQDRQGHSMLPNAFLTSTLTMQDFSRYGNFIPDSDP